MLVLDPNINRETMMQIMFGAFNLKEYMFELLTMCGYYLSGTSCKAIPGIGLPVSLLDDLCRVYLRVA